MLIPTESNLPDRFWSKVALTDTCWLWVGAKSTNGYGNFWWNRRFLVPHRLAYEDLVGPIPEGMQIDHVCFTHACVRPDHLRIVTAKQNQEHRQGAQSNSKTGVRGVRSEGKRFRAEIGHNGRQIWLGYFDTIEEAAAAYSAAADRLFTHHHLEGSKL